MKYSVNEVISNKLKCLEPVTYHIGNPFSDRMGNWEKGRITPVVYSYIERDGEFFWQFEGNPTVWAKHKEGRFKLVANRGGAKYIGNGGSIVAGFNDFFSSIPKLLEYGLIGIIGLVGLKIFFELK